MLKVQFPGVKESISSDLDSMLTLMGVTMKRGSRALEQNAHTFKGYKAAWLLECDYRLEAANLKRYAALVAADADAAYWDEKFEVPTLIDALCAERVIGMSFVSGVTLDQLCGSHVSQAVRDDVADRLVKLKLKEMFGWRFLNADPHMGNFVYNSVTKKLGLLDYGSCKEMDAGLAKGRRPVHARVRRRRPRRRRRVVRGGGRGAGGGRGGVGRPNLRVQRPPVADVWLDAPFDFFAWYQDPKLQGFKQNVEYQNEAWSKQKVDEKQPNALMKPEILLITEYLMQIMLHCGRLKAKIPVRKYLLAAVEA